jgi:hypothetical protein
MTHSPALLGNDIHPNLVAFTEKFIELPANWLPKIAGKPIPLPIWSSVFLANNPEHHAIIKALLREIEDDGEDASLKEFWYRVGDTGFITCQVEGRIFLGVDGAGYCFYKAHWEPLFELIFSS